jgi:hypothetical protein
MSFQVLKFHNRIVGTPARYRVDKKGTRVSLMLRADVASAAGFEPGNHVIFALGRGEHEGQLAMKRVDEKRPPKWARRSRLCGASLLVELPWRGHLEKLLPRPEDSGPQTVPLEVVETDRNGAVTVKVVKG